MLNFSKIVHLKEEQETMNTSNSEFTFLMEKSGPGIPREFPEDVSFLKETIRHLEDKLARIYHELKDKEGNLALREKACEQTSYSLHVAIEKLEKAKKQTNHELMRCKILLQEAAERENVCKYRLHESEEKIALLGQELDIANKKSIQQEIQIAQKDRQIAQQERQIVEQQRQIAELTNFLKFQGRPDMRPPEIRPQVFRQSSSQEESNYSPHFMNKNAQEEDTLSLATASKNNGLPPRNRPTPFGYSQSNTGMYLRGLQVVSDNEPSETRMNTIEKQVEELAADICEIKQVLMQISRKLDTKSSDLNQDKVYSTINSFLKAE